MSENLLTNRYAKALYEFAKNEHNEERVLADIELFSFTMRDNIELQGLLLKPIITVEKKLAIMRRVFAEHLSETTMRFIEMVITKNREQIFRDIRKEYEAIYNEDKNINIVYITSAVALDESTQQRIVALLRKKTTIKGEIRVKNIIDKKIIGGVIINYLDYRYDASIRFVLNKMQHKFEENLYVRSF